MLRTPVLRRQSCVGSLFIASLAEAKYLAKAMAGAKVEVKAEATRAKADAKWSSTGASVGSRGLGPS